MSNIPDSPGAPNPPAPRSVLSPEARKAAFAAGRPTMPIRYIYWTVGILVLVILGAVVADGVVSTSATAPPVYPHHAAPPARELPSFLQPTPAGTTTLHAPLAAFLGLRTGHERPAPGFTLTNAATHAPVSLSDLRGHVVVLSFADAGCDDICPVLGAELARARSQLPSTSVPVTFVTVNSDPLDLHEPTILTAPGFSHLEGWRFLTGTIDRLNAVWTDYGITVTVDRTTGRVSHDDRVYLIGPTGRLVWGLTPFANEDRTGSYSLAQPDIARFAQGIAHYASKLANAA